MTYESKYDNIPVKVVPAENVTENIMRNKINCLYDILKPQTPEEKEEKSS